MNDYEVRFEDSMNEDAFIEFVSAENIEKAIEKVAKKEEEKIGAIRITKVIRL